MKATGVVRRIDDLGRIVIPIEIRRNMKIRDGDPLEIFVDKDGEVILKKYSAVAELGDFAVELAESLHQATGHPTFITDRDVVVTVSGAPEKTYVERPVGPVVRRAMEDRSVLSFSGDRHNHEDSLFGEAESCEFYAEVLAPIVVAGDPIGTVIVASRDADSPIDEVAHKLAVTAAGFVARHMEE